MALAGYAVELLFGALGIIPTDRNVAAITEGPSLSYTAVLNAVFLVVAAVLVWRFLRTGGPAMLRMMNKPEGDMSGTHGYADHDHGGMAGRGEHTSG
jgi:membrane protein implicated in regulation of membrane protease activity